MFFTKCNEKTIQFFLAWWISMGTYVHLSEMEQIIDFVSLFYTLILSSPWHYPPLPEQIWTLKIQQVLNYSVWLIEGWGNSVPGLRLCVRWPWLNAETSKHKMFALIWPAYLMGFLFTTCIPWAGSCSRGIYCRPTVNCILVMQSKSLSMNHIMSYSEFSSGKYLGFFLSSNLDHNLPHWWFHADFFPPSLLTGVFDDVMSTMKSVGRLPVFLMSMRC